MPITSPSDISGLAWRVRGDGVVFQNSDGTVAAGSGDPVGYWGDEAGANHLVQPTTSKKPTLVADALNGHAGLVFDGDDFLYNEIPATLRTVYAVGRLDSTAVNLAGLLTNYPKEVAKRRHNIRRHDLTESYRAPSTGTADENDVVQGGSLRINGSEGAAITYGEYHFIVASANADVLFDGLMVSNKNNRMWKGTVVEIGGYNRVLTAQEVEDLEAWLNAEYMQAGGTPEPVTVSADYTEIPIQTYSAGITQGQQIGADFTQVPIESYGAGVEISPVEVGASYTEVSVTSYGAGVEIGSAGIGATYTEVPVYSFDASITQGRIVSAAYDEISVSTYDVTVIPGAIGIGADFTQIDVSTFDASVTQGVGIGASFDEVPVTSFAASIIQGLRIQAAFTQIEVTSYSAEIVDGSIIRPNRMDCFVRPYYQITASVRPYYDITATVNPAIQ